MHAHAQKEQADEAIKASYEAFKKWSLTSVEERVRVLRRLAKHF